MVASLGGATDIARPVPVRAFRLRGQRVGGMGIRVDDRSDASGALEVEKTCDVLDRRGRTCRPSYHSRAAPLGFVEAAWKVAVVARSGGFRLQCCGHAIDPTGGQSAPTRGCPPRGRTRKSINGLFTSARIR